MKTGMYEWVFFLDSFCNYYLTRLRFSDTGGSCAGITSRRTSTWAEPHCLCCRHQCVRQGFSLAVLWLQVRQGNRGSAYLQHYLQHTKYVSYRHIPIEPKHYLFVGSWWKHRVLRGLEWKHRLFIQFLWNPYFSRRKPVFIRRKPVKKWWVIWQKPSFWTEPVFFSETSCFLTGLLFSAVFGSLGRDYGYKNIG